MAARWATQALEISPTSAFHSFNILTYRELAPILPPGSFRVLGEAEHEERTLRAEPLGPRQWGFPCGGGFAYTADEGRTSVRYPDDEVQTRHGFLLFRSDPKPRPGSEVMVPLKDPSNPTNYVAPLGAIAQILASTLAIIVVATKL